MNGNVALSHPGRENYRSNISKKKKSPSTQNIKYLGPIVEDLYDQGGNRTLAIRPFLYHKHSFEENLKETYLLYPLLKHTKSAECEAWNIFNLIHFRNLQNADHNETRFTIFPFFSINKTEKKENNFEGIFPFAGKVHHYFGYDSLEWSWFPLYLKQSKGPIDRISLLWPFIRWQKGPNAGGWALWPFCGHFWEKNHYSYKYFLWPLIYDIAEISNISEPRRRTGCLPFYTMERSENRRATSIGWPLFQKIEEKSPEYDEIQFLWPLVIHGQGKEKYINQWAPLYSHRITKGIEKKFYFWPLIQQKKWKERSLIIDQQQLLYFLVWSQRQYKESQPNMVFAEKTHVWPLYSYWNNGQGKKQFQLLSPLEVFFPNNEVVRKVYSPLFALFRYNQNEKGQIQQSIFFDLIKSEHGLSGEKFSIGPLFNFESRPGVAKIELLKGLFGYQKISGKKTIKLFWIKL